MRFFRFSATVGVTLLSGWLVSARADFISVSLGTPGASNYALSGSGSSTGTAGSPGTVSGAMADLSGSQGSSSPASSGGGSSGGRQQITDTSVATQPVSSVTTAVRGTAAAITTVATPSAPPQNTTANSGSNALNVSNVNLNNAPTVAPNGPTTSQQVINASTPVQNSNGSFNLGSTTRALQTPSPLTSPPTVAVSNLQNLSVPAPASSGTAQVNSNRQVESAPTTPSVPEPASVILVILGGAGLVVINLKSRLAARLQR